MQYFFGAIIFLFGAAVGSFVLVVAERYNTGLPFLRGRSICFSCGQELKSRDLFPIFSFLFLRGRCRHCRSQIPRAAFLIEVLMGILSLLAAFKAGLTSEFLIFNFKFLINFLILNFIFANILLISIYDLKHFIIPDSFLISLFVFSLLYIILNTYPIIHSILSALAVTLPFLIIFLVSRGRWLGFGDVKYILVLGFWLGAAAGISGVILAFWIGAAFSLLALLFKYFKSQIRLPGFVNNLTIKSEIPFGPFLSLGAIISFYLNLDIFHINELLSIL